MSRSKTLNLFYDSEADVLYFSKGTPSGRDISDEAADEIVVRRNAKTREVTGFTILNFSKKSKKKSQFSLPLEVDLRQPVSP